MADISVLMPARDAAPTISRALASVLAEPEVAEVVVVDDGSRDGTAAIALGVDDPRVRVVPGPQRGVAAALNAGAAAATGAYLARCDADDLYVAGRLSGQRAFLASHPDYVAVSAGFASVDEDEAHLADLACDGEAREVTEDLHAGNVVTHLCTWLIRRTAWDIAGGAREWFETAEDLDLQFRLAHVGRVWHVPEVGYLYRLHDQSITHTGKKARVLFFDTAARDFARDRSSTGNDALGRGAPPPVPDFRSNAGRSRARDQMVGHLTAQAWRNFGVGRTEEALAKLGAALRRRPLSLSLWRGYLMMRLKAWRAGR